MKHLNSLIIYLLLCRWRGGWSVWVHKILLTFSYDGIINDTDWYTMCCLNKLLLTVYHITVYRIPGKASAWMAESRCGGAGVNKWCQHAGGNRETDRWGRCTGSSGRYLSSRNGNTPSLTISTIKTIALESNQGPPTVGRHNSCLPLQHNAKTT